MTRPLAQVYVAIDLGATSGRVLMNNPLDDDGTARWTVARRFRNVPKAGSSNAVWDVATLFDETIAGLRTAVQLAGRWNARIGGIAVCSWGVDYGLLQGGELRVPPRRYQRIAEQDLRHTLEVVDAGTLYATTGVLPQKINTAVQLHRDMREGILRADDQLLFIADLWTYWLCGSAATDATMASTTQLFNFSQGDWDSELLETFGLAPGLMPELGEVGARAGELIPRIRRRIGADYSIPIWRVAAHDTANALATALRFAYGKPAGLVSSGSWIVTAAPTSAQDPLPPIDQGLTHEIGSAGERFAMVNLVGLRLVESCLAVWKTQGRPITIESSVDVARNAHSFQTLDLEAIEADSPGDVISRILAQRVPNDPGAILRSLIETLAQNTVDALSRTECPGLDRVVLVGGGARNAVFAQALARRSKMVVVAGAAEAAAIGNVLQQRHAAEGVVGLDGELESKSYLPDAIEERSIR